VSINRKRFSTPQSWHIDAVEGRPLHRLPRKGATRARTRVGKLRVFHTIHGLVKCKGSGDQGVVCASDAMIIGAGCPQRHSCRTQKHQEAEKRKVQRRQATKSPRTFRLPLSTQPRPEAAIGRILRFEPMCPFDQQWSSSRRPMRSFSVQ
jgi:hypothetical protein